MTRLLRRRRVPAHLREPLRVFEAIVPTLEQAKAALTASVPGTRMSGRPLAESLLEFEQGLESVRARMDAWRAAEVEDVWVAASAGLDESLARAERVRTQAAEPSGFEGLIGLIGELLAPVESFRAAGERFRELRS